mmetsp:Transcript_89889/g.254253  ORF Transcript_89889/g.254253 Transcript_89889/m.254253 type:complete len:218 (-) Transcript_89889:292-945(-)
MQGDDTQRVLVAQSANETSNESEGHHPGDRGLYLEENVHCSEADEEEYRARSLDCSKGLDGCAQLPDPWGELEALNLGWCLRAEAEGEVCLAQADGECHTHSEALEDCLRHEHAVLVEAQQDRESDHAPGHQGEPRKDLCAVRGSEAHEDAHKRPGGAHNIEGRIPEAAAHEATNNGSGNCSHRRCASGNAESQAEGDGHQRDGRGGEYVGKDHLGQ